MIFAGILVLAIPRISAVFKDSGIEPPFFSRMVFGLGEFAQAHIVSLTLISVVILSVMAIFFGKTVVGRRVWRRFIHRVPVLRNVFQDLAIERFASTFSSLTKAGVPVMQALRITADAVGSDDLKESLIRITDEGLAKGLTIGDSFRREAALPRVVTNLIAISDRAGHLEEMLFTLAEFYRNNIQNTLKTLVSVIEPLLLLFMGFIIAFVALSIIVPVYQLSNQVGA